MSDRYLIRLTPPSTSKVHQHQQHRANRPRDLLSSLQSARIFKTGLLVGKRDGTTTFSDSGGYAGFLASDWWTVRFESCCQDQARHAGFVIDATPFDAPVANVSPRYSTDRLLIQSVKWFTLARCLFSLMHNWGVRLLFDAHAGRDFLTYPSDAHNQARLKVAACVTLRVLSSHCWSHLPVHLALTPTPNEQ